MSKSLDKIQGYVKPSGRFLKRVARVLHNYYDESKTFQENALAHIDEYRDIYDCVTKSKAHEWEANLILPKGNYIIETIAPQIMSAVFSQSQWLTTKDYMVPDEALYKMDKWLVWFCDRYMNFYLQALQLFKQAPIDGTSLVKLYFQNGVPKASYFDLKDFYPDPGCTVPGAVDEMRYCFHRTYKTFADLDQATVLRALPAESVSGIEAVGAADIQQQLGDNLGLGTAESVELRHLPKYFNLDKVWQHTTEVIKLDKDGEVLDTTVEGYKVLEYIGQVETTFGIYDDDRKSYKPGKYEEYIITALEDGVVTENPDLIIRAEPSPWVYYDPLEMRDKPVKPFVASVFCVKPGSFYGQSALKPVQSLIEETQEIHNLYLDNMKRSVSTILQVLQHTGLTEEDLEFRPMGVWYVRDHDDVRPVQFPMVNLGSFAQINAMLQQEIDRGSTPMAMQGVATTKRQTGTEFQSLLAEGSRRFSTFIQSADRLTLRPFVQKTKLMLSKMPQVIFGQAFQSPFGEIYIDPRWLLYTNEMEFAATGVEPEHSVYMKQQIFPQILQSVGQLIAAGGGQYVMNLPALLSEMEAIYGFKNIDQFVQDTMQLVSIDALIQAVGNDPEAQQQVAQLFKIAKQMELEASGGAGGSA